jgi:hypothetical protein
MLLRTVQAIAVEASFKSNKINHLQDLDPQVLLYGSETWVLTKREENQLLVFERKVLRTICGPKLGNGVYRRRYNFELQREFDSPYVINILKMTR